MKTPPIHRGMRLFLAMALSAATAFWANAEQGPAQAPVRYPFDPGQSRFFVRVYSAGLLKAFGHTHTIAIRNFTGEARFAPGADIPTAITMVIQADSLRVVDQDVSESDRQKIEREMRTNVLAVARYPQITFRSTQITGRQTGAGAAYVQVTGELTLHGVTRPIRFEAETQRQGQQLRATGAFSVRQTDFNIKPVTVAGGTIKVKDEVSLNFDVQGHE